MSQEWTNPAYDPPVPGHQILVCWADRHDIRLVTVAQCLDGLSYVGEWSNHFLPPDWWRDLPPHPDFDGVGEVDRAKQRAAVEAAERREYERLKAKYEGK